MHKDYDKTFILVLTRIKGHELLSMPQDHIFCDIFQISEQICAHNGSVRTLVEYICIYCELTGICPIKQDTYYNK